MTKLRPYRIRDEFRFFDREGEASRLSEECFQAIRQVLATADNLPQGAATRIAQEASDWVMLEVNKAFVIPTSAPKPKTDANAPRPRKLIDEINKRQVQKLLKHRRKIDKRKPMTDTQRGELDDAIQANNWIDDGKNGGESCSSIKVPSHLAARLGS